MRGAGESSPSESETGESSSCTCGYHLTISKQVRRGVMPQAVSEQSTVRDVVINYTNVDFDVDDCKWGFIDDEQPSSRRHRRSGSSRRSDYNTAWVSRQRFLGLLGARETLRLSGS